VLAVSPRAKLYAGGRRRILPPLQFGLGVLAHLVRHGKRYDVVHTASFPYFSLLAAGLARRRSGYRIAVDWHELWTRAYWRRYAGRFAGRIGWGIQRACIGVPQRAFCFSRLHERRLREQGFTGVLTRLEGQYAGPPPPERPAPARRVVVFAGRHIPEKRVPALVPALATALCFALPSEREGYGLVVVESSARGVPSVVVSGPDNAATELVEDGVNGAVAASASADDLAEAIRRARDGGDELRASTLAWFRRNSERLSLESSLQLVLRDYARADS
jgi:glycosyltransferase involved in cell wall biosynthesis